MFERFNADYREFSRLMDQFLPDARALPYVPRLARLTKIRAYVRAHFLREDASVNWTDIGAKVKKLLDERIDAEVRELMKPVSILDRDFEAKIAHLPHDEARASVMEHALRAQITERLADNPVFYEKLSQQLERIIQELRQKLIDSVEACRRMAALRGHITTEAEVAAQHGLSPVSFAVYELLERSRDGLNTKPAEHELREEKASYRAEFDEALKGVALKVEAVMATYQGIVDWQGNFEVQRQMRRDIKRELRVGGSLTEEELDDLAREMVEVAKRRLG